MAYDYDDIGVKGFPLLSFYLDIMVQEKKLIDQVSGWLRLYSDGTVDRTWTGPPEVQFMVEPVPPHEDFINEVATRDVIINKQSNHQVRIYLPKQENSETKLPIILHFHGGGFCISQANWYMYYQAYTKLAQSVPAIVVSVYLRLAPEHKLPAACEDGFAALLWLRSVASGEVSEPWLEEHADFKRVFLIGDSSGGNLVHEVAAMAGKENMINNDPLRLAGGIPVHPGFVRSERSRSELEQPQSAFLTLDMVDKFLSLALPAGSTKDHPISCPMGSEAPPMENLSLPPFFLCLAEKDMLWDTEMEYYEAMKKAGKDVELFISQGMGHSFYLNKVAVDMDPATATETDTLFAGIAEFIRKH